MKAPARLRLTYISFVFVFEDSNHTPLIKVDLHPMKHQGVEGSEYVRTIHISAFTDRRTSDGRSLVE